MVYDENDRPALVGYVAPGQTPYHDLNPGYKVYTIDGDYEGSTYVSTVFHSWFTGRCYPSWQALHFTVTRESVAYSINLTNNSSYITKTDVHIPLCLLDCLVF